MPQPRHSKPPADRRREALADELLRAQQRPIEEARAWWLSIYAIVAMAVALIALVAVLIVLVAS
ncbi:MAG: hypothetical protein QOF69_1526 [Solirubrobacteraceae bacterium]|jgi:hypothetical protein|nr:hypothetical protein [Solirubrobacteraceae bacterium]